MNTKNKIYISLLSIINFFACLFLTIFVLPSSIPVVYNFYEKITIFGTKWIMLSSVIIPTIFAILCITIKDKYTVDLFKILLTISLYENALFFAYFSLSTNLTVGSLCDIPHSLVTFMPLSIFIIYFALKLKKVPYLSKFGIRFKTTKETAFIWNQAHYFARNLFFGMGGLLFFISIIFTFVRFNIIQLPIFVIVIAVFLIIFYNYTYSIYDKYMEMKERQDEQQRKKEAKEKDTKSNTNTKSNSKTTSTESSNTNTDTNSETKKEEEPDSISEKLAENLKDENLTKKEFKKLKKEYKARIKVLKRRAKRKKKQKPIDGSKLM